jgi:hypothetical protein
MTKSSVARKKSEKEVRKARCYKIAHFVFTILFSKILYDGIK